MNREKLISLSIYRNDLIIQLAHIEYKLDSENLPHRREELLKQQHKKIILLTESETAIINELTGTT